VLILFDKEDVLLSLAFKWYVFASGCHFTFIKFA
jgi:hypothetical protein